MTRIADIDPERLRGASRSWRIAAFGLAVLVSLSIHAAVLVLIPEREDSGTAVGAGQGGIMVSLGAAGRETGGEVMKAENEPLDVPASEVAPDTPETVTPAEQVETAETVPVVEQAQSASVQEVRLAAVEEVQLREPAERAITEPSEVKPVVASELLVAEAPSEIAPLKSATLDEVPAEAETAVVPVQEATRAANVPPLPRRRPDRLRREPAPGEIVKLPTPEPQQKTVSEVKQAQAVPPKNSPREAAATLERGSVEGRTNRQTASLVTGAGGRSGSSGSVDTGQDVATQGGGIPGAESDYLHELRIWLEKHKRYPRRSKLRNEQGVVLLHLVVARNGDVSSFAIAKSSGYDRLDDAVMKLVERARPMPPLPGDLDQNNVNVVVPVEFSLH